MASGLGSRGVSHLTEGHPETGQRLLLWTSAPLPLRKSCEAVTAICPGQLGLRDWSEESLIFFIQDSLPQHKSIRAVTQTRGLSATAPCLYQPRDGQPPALGVTVCTSGPRLQRWRAGGVVEWGGPAWELNLQLYPGGERLEEPVWTLKSRIPPPPPPGPRLRVWGRAAPAASTWTAVRGRVARAGTRVRGDVRGGPARARLSSAQAGAPEGTATDFKIEVLERRRASVTGRRPPERPRGPFPARVPVALRTLLAPPAPRAAAPAPRLLAAAFQQTRRDGTEPTPATRNRARATTREPAGPRPSAPDSRALPAPPARHRPWALALGDRGLGGRERAEGTSLRSRRAPRLAGRGDARDRAGGAGWTEASAGPRSGWAPRTHPHPRCGRLGGRGLRIWGAGECTTSPGARRGLVMSKPGRVARIRRGRPARRSGGAFCPAGGCNCT
ncbi:translation initiation factor IF-2-like [Mustela erminea]|uniref:translation initiation factor IF-2-like n=1 Tax=Mustela erminea TaxID=36723 RepID=UPI001386C445|nr:translation initiation factor IF-2-like [Mustela erminea]